MDLRLQTDEGKPDNEAEAESKQITRIEQKRLQHVKYVAMLQSLAGKLRSETAATLLRICFVFLQHDMTTATGSKKELG